MQTAKPKRAAARVTAFWAMTLTELAVVLWAVGSVAWAQPDSAAADALLASAVQASAASH
jgi:hypothetical protein